MSDKDISSGIVKLLEQILRKRKNNNLYVVLAIVVILAAVVMYIGPPLLSYLSGGEDTPPVAVINELTDAEKAEILKNKAIKIKQGVLGEARERRELLVLEQEMKIESQWEDSWQNLEIFKKTKKIVSYGTGYYNIDLSGLDENSINVDNDKRVVTITVPHAVLKSISIDEGKTEYEDTQRDGFFGFGELKLTAEQQGLFKKKVEDEMRVELEKPELLEKADTAGKVSVTEIYRPLVSAVADNYTVEVIVGNP